MIFSFVVIIWFDDEKIFSLSVVWLEFADGNNSLNESMRFSDGFIVVETGVGSSSKFNRFPVFEFVSISGSIRCSWVSASIC